MKLLNEAITREIQVREHRFLLMWWINLKSWGFRISFIDGFMLQILCFYFEIDKEY